ncbi:hypothetical protein Q5P01_006502 [Channa striata]|uniref:Uncharacterized protein n=1 Tax=Channa striata TaxID=64152 RepID=A0AA88NCZ8_CHASR|nr:hypothetical protein Q5P01_006502 [Channa striata]
MTVEHFPKASKNTKPNCGNWQEKTRVWRLSEPLLHLQLHRLHPPAGSRRWRRTVTHNHGSVSGFCS